MDGTEPSALPLRVLGIVGGDMAEIGGRLVIRQGDAVAELEKLAIETRAEAIFFNRDPDPYGRGVEDRLEKMGNRLGISIRPFKDIAIHERDEVLTGGGDPFRVFTPYSKAWAKLAKPPVAKRIQRMQSPSGIFSSRFPRIRHGNCHQLPGSSRGW